MRGITMVHHGTFCLLALAVSNSAFAPSRPASAVVRENGSLIVMKTATESASSVIEISSSTSTSSVLRDFDYISSNRLPYSPTGYATWEWNTHHNAKNQEVLKNNNSLKSNGDDGPSYHRMSHSINYLEMGDPAKPALILVHGFGASSYHFRHNIPILARNYHVYALDLLGFGWSDKPVMDYDASVWRDQVVDFVRDVVMAGDGETQTRPIAIAGNSLGGYTAMYASSDERIKEHVKGCVLLNAAGRFRDPYAKEDKGEPNPIVEAISSAIQRFVIACSFVYTKQPARIDQILRQVYPINNSNVDAELVESIRTPALEETAAEVFYRVITKNGRGPQAYIDDILRELECPVLLAWGESDPWIKSAAADRMEMLHAQFHGENVGGMNGPRWMKRASIDAGHCPHDEAPEAVNDAILQFLDPLFKDI